MSKLTWLIDDVRSRVLMETILWIGTGVLVFAATKWLVSAYFEQRP